MLTYYCGHRIEWISFHSIVALGGFRITSHRHRCNYWRVRHSAQWTCTPPPLPHTQQPRTKINRNIQAEEHKCGKFRTLLSTLRQTKQHNSYVHVLLEHCRYVSKYGGGKMNFKCNWYSAVVLEVQVNERRQLYASAWVACIHRAECLSHAQFSIMWRWLSFYPHKKQQQQQQQTHFARAASLYAE